MKEIISSYKKDKSLHHLYILEGDRENIFNEVYDFCKNCLKCHTESLIELNFDRFLVEEAKDIINQSIIKTMGGQKKIFAISFNSATNGAQNSLLKVIEEPTDNTHFFIIVPRIDIFLPTVLSRAIIIRNREDTKSNLLKDLLSKKPADRIKWADDLAKKISDGKIEKSEARKSVTEIISGLERNQENSNILKRLLEIDNYLKDQGSSNKLLLERTSLILK